MLREDAARWAWSGRGLLQTQKEDESGNFAASLIEAPDLGIGICCLLVNLLLNLLVDL